MKLTKTNLKQLIKEEYKAFLQEQSGVLDDPELDLDAFSAGAGPSATQEPNPGSLVKQLEAVEKMQADLKRRLKTVDETANKNQRKQALAEAKSLSRTVAKGLVALHHKIIRMYEGTR